MHEPYTETKYILKHQWADRIYNLFAKMKAEYSLLMKKSHHRTACFTSPIFTQFEIYECSHQSLEISVLLRVFFNNASLQKSAGINV